MKTIVTITNEEPFDFGTQVLRLGVVDRDESDLVSKLAGAAVTLVRYFVSPERKELFSLVTAEINNRLKALAESNDRLETLLAEDDLIERRKDDKKET